MSTKRCLPGELEPGMVLALPINDDKGRTIMPEGSRLTPMHIKRLEKWGIESVVIQLDGKAPVPESEPVDAETKNRQEQDHETMRHIAMAVQQRFSNTAGDPIMDTLKKLAVKHLVTKELGLPEK